MAEDPGIPHTLDHVAFGVADVEGAAGFLVGTLGGRPYEGGHAFTFDFWQWRFAAGEKIELIAPAGEKPDFLHRFLASRGPGVHHVTVYVRDLDAAVARVRAFGLDVVGHFDANPGWKEAFLHPKVAQGIVVQLAWTDPVLDSTLDPGWRYPAPEGEPPEPARLDELVLSARDEKAARRQWGELLGGRVEEPRPGDGPRRIRFRWPGNGMAVAVEIDPERAEGPLHLEVAADRPLALSEAPQPALGAVFRRAD